MAAAGVVSVAMGVMELVLEKVTALMGDEYEKLKRLRDVVSFLREEHKAMNALLEKMDAADKLDRQEMEWRIDILDMSYDIEDSLVEFMQCVGEAGPGDNVGILQKIVQDASGFLTTLKDRYRIANKLDEIKNRVIQTSDRRKRFKLNVSSTAPVDVDSRLSPFFKDSATLVGIDSQKEELVRWAMDEAQRLKVASIVGLGGLGKTTLANEVYRQVAGQFDCKALVCVSQRPDTIKLLNSVVSQIGLQPSHAYKMDVINQIRNHLQDKRYLIVVDDLWDTDAWDTIQCAFPDNNKHSRVVITTRNGVVATACCSNHGYRHNMKALSEEDSRKLFFNRVFGSEDDCPSQLIDVSRDILKKCGGLPLAIITIGSILACAPTNFEREWEYIQDSLIAESAANNRRSTLQDMMHILDLSYKSLPYELKACFLYLGTYLEDHLICKPELVRRWVAEGFVRDSPRRDAWDVAESYFNELVNRSMIQPIYWNSCEVSHCRVHDMMLELIVRRCKEDNFLSLADGPEALAETQGQGKAIRRLTVDLRGAKDVVRSTARNLSKIRSLTVMGELNWIPPMAEFKFLRVLALQNQDPRMRRTTVDLTGIVQLSQLRYVSVVSYGDMVLPGQIRGLQWLETLVFDDEFGFGSGSCTLPSDIFEVPRLTHLVAPWCMSLPLPEGIGKAKSLRTLRNFFLPDSLPLLERSIEELGELPVLSELELCGTPRWGQMDAWKAAASARFGSLSAPFRRLQKLHFQGFTLSRVPGWIGHLDQLRVLGMEAEQIFQEDVNVIGTRLASLVVLSLRIVDIPTERIFIGASTSTGWFPHLQFFRFECDGISRLTFEAGAMPRLRQLQFYFDADHWDKAPPQGLHHLQSLQVIHAVNEAKKSRPTVEEREAADAMARGVFEEAFDALSTRPRISAFRF